MIITQIRGGERAPVPPSPPPLATVLVSNFSGIYSYLTKIKNEIKTIFINKEICYFQILVENIAVAIPGSGSAFF